MDETLGSVEKGETLEGRKDTARIHRLLGDSATFDFSPYARNIDLFFIDGAHTYEYVKNDTLKALECCHPGSVIAWHDYGRMGINGVTRWLHEFVRSHFPVYRVPNGSLAFGIVR
jgi:Methyltransferase domain